MSDFIFHRFLFIYLELKRIWVEGGDPSGASNFSLEVNKSKNCTHTEFTRLGIPRLGLVGGEELDTLRFLDRRLPLLTILIS